MLAVVARRAPDGPQHGEVVPGRAERGDRGAHAPTRMGLHLEERGAQVTREQGARGKERVGHRQVVPAVQPGHLAHVKVAEQAVRLRLAAQAIEHAAGQVARHHAVPLGRKRQGQRARAAPHVDDRLAGTQRGAGEKTVRVAVARAQGLEVGRAAVPVALVLHAAVPPRAPPATARSSPGRTRAETRQARARRYPRRQNGRPGRKARRNPLATFPLRQTVPSPPLLVGRTDSSPKGQYSPPSQACPGAPPRRPARGAPAPRACKPP